MQLNTVEQRLLNDFQRDFPLERRPYARLAAKLGISEEEVLERLAGLRRRGAVSRIGAVVRPGTVGASTLAAMRVPEDRLEAVADMVSAYAEVNHNYERGHAINLWFVVTAGDETRLLGVLASLEEETGIPVMDLRLVTPFHIDLGFDLS
jgi:DNA-binding Lrp family transcriptional regulator